MMYFKIFEIPVKFAFEEDDKTTLEEKFLLLQKNNYENQDVISIQSTTLNIAYEILSKETKRLHYIFKNLGIEIEEIKMTPSLASYIFELREEIEEYEDENHLESKIAEIELELNEVRGMLEYEIQKALSGKQNNEILCELFSKFKCIKEIIKSSKKRI